MNENCGFACCPHNPPCPRGGMALTKALEELWTAGRIRSPFLIGMSWSGLTCVVWQGSRSGFCEQDEGAKFERWTIDQAVHSGLTPELTLGATVGCLMTLLREAVSAWTPDNRSGATLGRDAKGWHVWVQTGPYATERFDGAFQGDAVASALVCIAERLQGAAMVQAAP